MTRETLGYVKLEWTCPKCNNRNPGPEKTCLSCGAPQPQNVQFVQAVQQELGQDETLKKTAQAGADIHCAFCGTRNPANATICSQCGADLKSGTRRETGRVVGAFIAGPAKQIACPSCGTMNLGTALKCTQCGAQLQLKPTAVGTAPSATTSLKSNKLVVILAAAFVLLCICAVISYAFLSAPHASQRGIVEDVEWQTSVAIEELGLVTHAAWQDEIPQDAQLGNCADKVRQTVDTQPGGGKYNKVCGTPYTLDTGSGVGQVVQDCQFEILAPYCEYTVQEWQVANEVKQSGNDLSPVFASPQLSSNQRLGSQNTSYVIFFDADKGQYTYTVTSLNEFQKFQIGSQWILKINSFGNVVSVEPAQ
jgi:membrane protease subunit (stomatin/prohibitin family)